MKTVYKCEKCGEGYADQTECISCEESHRVPTEIVDFNGYCIDDYDAPSEIVLKMSDGTEAVYVFSYRLTQERKATPSVFDRFVSLFNGAVNDVFARNTKSKLVENS